MLGKLVLGEGQQHGGGLVGPALVGTEAWPTSTQAYRTGRKPQSAADCPSLDDRREGIQKVLLLMGELIQYSTTG